MSPNSNVQQLFFIWLAVSEVIYAVPLEPKSASPEASSSQPILIPSSIIDDSKKLITSSSVASSPSSFEPLINPFIETEDDFTDVMEELDPNDPKLLQMGSFAARQMSTKKDLFKLMEVTEAERSGQTFRLSVTLKRLRFSPENRFQNYYDSQYLMPKNSPYISKDVLYCNVEIFEDVPNHWTMDGFGCSLPAMVRVRNPETIDESSKPIRKFEDQLNNNEIEHSTRPKQQFFSPMQNYRQNSIMMPYWIPKYQQIPHQYRFYY